MFNFLASSVQHQITLRIKIAYIQEHVLPLHDLTSDLTMLNAAVSSVQHHITLR
jgi:hypothetical protein